MTFWIFISVLTLAAGWGGDGHRLITSLATRYMSSRNADWLTEQVGDLLRASTWADSDEAETIYPLSGAYHFSNTPYRKCAAFDLNRDCGIGKTKGLCIVTGLSDAIARAVDPDSSQSERTDSLKFILHLMADIHQPLHTGFREDSGGLRVTLSEPDGVDLHAIWDTVLINELMTQYRVTEWTGLIDPLTSRLESNNGGFAKRVQSQYNLTDIVHDEARITDYIAGLASETSLNTTCRSGYKNLNDEWIGVGDYLSSEYFNSRIPIVIVQLLKASVRLGSILDVIANTIYDRRQVAKEARREARVATLFSKRPIEQACESWDQNRFTDLFIDFDPVASEYHPPTDLRSIIIGGRKRQPVQSRKTTSDSDNKLLREAIDSVKKERASYTFFDIDLSEIVLVKRSGVYLVSTKSKVADLSYMPPTVIVPISFSGSGRIEKQVFGFDGTIFSTALATKLIVRVILKITGIDPRIDITDYMNTITPTGLAAPIASPILDKLIADHAKRSARISLQGSVMDDINKLGKSIVRLLLDDRSVAFVLLETLKVQNSATRIRMNRYLIVGTVETVSVLLDPGICDRTLEFDRLPVYFQQLAKKITRVPGSEIRGRLFNELTEIAQFARARDSGKQVPQHFNGEFVEWVFDYPGDERRNYNVIEWFRKGTTAAQIVRTLGMPELPTVVNASIESIPPTLS